MKRLAGLPLETRVASVFGAYAIYGALAVRLAPPIIAYLHGHETASFDGLAPDETPGPLGGIEDPFGFVVLHYILLFLTMTPAFWFFACHWKLCAVLIIFNEPILFVGLLVYITIGGRY